MIVDISQIVQETWKTHTQYKTLGIDYLIFITQNDIQDMKDDNWDKQECIEEFCDILSNHIRYLYEVYDVSEMYLQDIQYRLTTQDFTKAHNEMLPSSAQKISQNLTTLSQNPSTLHKKQLITENILVAAQTIQKVSDKTLTDEVRDRLTKRIQGKQEELTESMLEKYENQQR